MRYLQKYQVFKTSSIPGENYPELKKKIGQDAQNNLPLETKKMAGVA